MMVLTILICASCRSKTSNPGDQSGSISRYYSSKQRKNVAGIEKWDGKFGGTEVY